MKRAITLVASIIGTTLQGILLLETVFLFALITDIISAGNSVSGQGTLMLVMFIIIGLAVLGLIFNAISISAWNKEPSIYKKKRGFIITAIVFNILVVILSIIGFLGGESSINLFTILMLAGLLFSSILLIIDLAKEKGRSKQYQLEQTVALQEENDLQGHQSTLEEKIEKLNKMKEQGLINEQEYNKLKEMFIQKTL